MNWLGDKMEKRKRPLLVPERHALILKHLQDNDSASVETLTRLTRASESTIRRDLLELSARNSGLRRTHGGVVSGRLESSTYEPPAQGGGELNRGAKEGIGGGACVMFAARGLVFLALQARDPAHDEAHPAVLQRFFDRLDRLHGAAVERAPRALFDRKCEGARLESCGAVVHIPGSAAIRKR